MILGGRRTEGPPASNARLNGRSTTRELMTTTRGHGPKRPGGREATGEAGCGGGEPSQPCQQGNPGGAVKRASRTEGRPNSRSEACDGWQG